MFGFILKRLGSLIPVSLGVLLIVVGMIHFVPGDPVDIILGDMATAEDKLALRHELGLDQPLFQQTATYVSHAVRGDLGQSLVYQKSVNELIMQRLPATMRLAVASLIVALLISVPLGILAAVFQGTKIDFAAMSFAVSGVAVPTFWLGPLLILLFSVELGWLPVSEMGDWKSFILPAFTMGTPLAAALSRITRNSMLDTLKEDFVRTARAKGCSESRVILKHTFRNASLPLVTVVGLQFGVLMAGAIITEKVFDWPGLGSLLVEGINTRDYPVVQGCVLFFSMSYLIVNLLTDITYSLVDPRIRLST
ncbi:MAG: ABC transporter permease [Bdellovibrionota bacterium]